MDCSTRERGKVKNRDKKIVLVKSITQKKKQGIAQKKVCLVKVLELFLLCPVLVLVLGILGFGRKGTACLVGQLGMEMAGGCFFFYFPLSFVLWAIHYKQEL
jgi:arginine exporter protein ArgO